MENLKLVVRQVTNEALGIKTYEFADPNGHELPRFDAGAHVDLHIPGGYVRQYSLCNSPAENDRYLIGVLNDPVGRGGSKTIHQQLQVGTEIVVSPPRNNFAISENAEFHLLLAGGIGITPFMSMIEHFEQTGADYCLHYCTRAPKQTAFLHHLSARAKAGRVIHHFDGGNPAQGLNLGDLLKVRTAGHHLYYCGPAGFMDAVAHAAADWPDEAKHFEFFSPPPTKKVTHTDENLQQKGFNVTVNSTGQSYFVPPERSIIEVLRENGVVIETSCEAGICGTCKTAYLEGEPIHNDFVLTDAEKTNWVMLCCASSASATLLLDL